MNVRLAYVIGAIALFVAGMGLQVITTETGDAEVEAEFTFVDAAPTTTTSTTTSTTTTTTTTTVPPPRTACPESRSSAPPSIGIHTHSIFSIG